MPEFHYEALNTESQATSGTVEAESVAEAVARLEEDGLRVMAVSQVVAEAAVVEYAPAPTTTEPGEQQAIRKRLAEVLERREELAPALAAFAEELPRGRSRHDLRRLATRIRAGATAEELCGTEEASAACLPLLGGGKGSRRLLTDMLAEATREGEGRNQWTRALAYPALVLFGAVVVFLFLCVTVVPAFEDIFRDFNLQLPAPTLLVLKISGLVLDYPVLFFVAVAAGGIAIYALLRWVSRGGGGSLLNAFTTGNSRQVTAMARFVRRLAEALDAGLGLPASLRIAGRAEGPSSTRSSALLLAEDAERVGFDLTDSRYARRFPATVIHALSTGPGRRPNVPLLQELADLYTARIRERCNLSTGFMSFFAIVVLAFTVGFVALSLYLPLVSLLNGLS